MPDEERDQDRDDDDDNDADGSGASATISITNYNRTISHLLSCSFQKRAAPLYPDPRQSQSPLGSQPACSADAGVANRTLRAMIAVVGIVLALGMAGVALVQSRGSDAQYYSREVYGMDARSHRKWAFAAFGFIVLFVLSSLLHHDYDVMVGAAFAVIAILYFASFVRGYTSEDE